MKWSFWEKEVFTTAYDFAIVGAGIVGLRAAWILKECYPKAKVAVFERGIFPHGASTRNAGFACFGSIGELLADLETESEEVVHQRFLTRINGLEKLRRHVPDEAMDFEDCGNWELFTEEHEFDRCQNHISRFNTWMNESPLHQAGFTEDRVRGLSAIRNSGEGMLHSGKLSRFMQKRCRELGVEFFFGAGVRALSENRLHFEYGELQARHILCATNGFTKTVMPEMDVVPGRGSILVSKPMAGFPWRGAFHYNEGYTYFRNVGDRLLIGGARNIDLPTETTDSMHINSEIKAHLLEFVRSTLAIDSLEIEDEWSGIMGFAPGKNPIVKRVNNHLTVAVGLSGIGVAVGFQVAEDAVALLV